MYHSFIKDSKCDLHHGVICHPYLLAGSVVICLSTRVSQCGSRIVRPLISGAEKRGMERKKGKGDRCHFELLLESREKRESGRLSLSSSPAQKAKDGILSNM